MARDVDSRHAIHGGQATRNKRFLNRCGPVNALINVSATSMGGCWNSLKDAAQSAHTIVNNMAELNISTALQTGGATYKPWRHKTRRVILSSLTLPEDFSAGGCPYFLARLCCVLHDNGTVCPEKK